MKNQYSYIGKSINRVDAGEKVTGETQYVDDIRLPGMLYAGILGSPYAHARILKIDTSRAEKLPGVKAVITGKDIPDRKFCTNSGLLPDLDDKFPIEKEKVRYVGDEVAAVAAVDMETVEKALELIEVEYEPLDPVIDPEKSTSEDAPLVHDDHERNISVELNYSFGDVDKTFSEADYIFEDEFRTSHAAPCCMEPHGCIARWERNGRLTLYSSTQLASGYRRELSRIMGIPFGDVRIIQTNIGGSFGSKMAMHSIEPIAAHLSKITGRPVNLCLSRDEEFVSSRTRHPSIVKIKTGVNKDGRIIAREARIIFDNGAYNSQGVTALYKACTVLCSHYNIENVKVKGILVYTNKPYGGAFRGFGNPQATFAIESQLDIIAGKIKIDPVELRLKNAVKSGDVTPTGWSISSCGLSECLEKAAEAIDWKNKRGKRENRGVGLAACIHWGGGISVMRDSNLCSSIIELSTTGRIFVHVGSHEIGEGANTVITQIVAEELGVPIDTIEVMPVDTDHSPSFFFTGSPTTYVAGGAARMAAADVKKQLLEDAAKMKKVDPEALEIKDGTIYTKADREKVASVSAVARHSYELSGAPVVGKGSFDQGPAQEDIRKGYGQPSPTFSFVVQAAEVEVNPETGEVKVIKSVAACDCGTVVNPKMAEGQVEGALAQGLGFALTEGLVFDTNGKALNSSYTDYKVFRAQDMPDEIIALQVEATDPRGPFGAKSLGEAVIVPIAPAIANAIADATGLRIKDLPITPEKICSSPRES